MLVFELTPACDELEIHADREGLALLEKQLRALLSGERHVHLMTKAWAGQDLSEDVQTPDHKLLNHVKIVRWGD
jgi:hypothetical protein